MLKTASLENFYRFFDALVSPTTFLILFMLNLVAYFFTLWVSFGIDPVWGQRYLNIENLNFALLAGAFLLSYIISRRQKAQAFPGLSFGNPNMSQIIIFLVIGTLAGLFFAVPAITSKNQSITPVPSHLFVLQAAPNFIVNQLQIVGILINFALMPAITEEILVIMLMVDTYFFLTLLVNRELDLNRSLYLFLVAFFIGVAVFSLFHYDAVSNDLKTSYIQYQASPSQWAIDHPHETPPPNPESVAGFGYIVGQILWLFSFKMFISAIGIYFNSLWLMILAHLVNNILNFLYNPIYVFTVGPSAWPIALTIYLGFLALVAAQIYSSTKYERYAYAT